ncbi:T9SS type A sorting domain-containing protein [Parabacteroides chongii]|uniref:T9SS type A sorting domain-containing protein n=1 Tax=Parabacteroides chongii TaxID=2685834 RepID=UPI00240D7D88|nr:T9SS type A sorting domain-containing protein [Parabacteroides chongii]WFE86128.1 T9SS type A sorting domain-containing protein [Parabacteroides chongii]
MNMEINNSLHLSIKRLPIFVFFCLICGLVHAENTPWDGVAAKAIANEEGGNGLDVNQPILIATAGELAYLAQQTNAGGKELELTNGDKISEYTNFQDLYFQLTEDIDLNNKKWLLIGCSADVPFKGYFDGNNKTISNLANITESDDINYAGLFGYIENGSVQNLHIEIAEAGLHTTSVGYVGALAGYVKDSPITNCSVKGGDITSEADSKLSSQLTVGGLIGHIITSYITDCRSSVNVKATLTGGSGLMVGGITGINAHSSFTNCHYSGSVMAVDERKDASPNSYAGGITGTSDLSPVGLESKASTISQCTACVNISAGAYAGGIVGDFSEGTIEKCWVKGVISTKETEGQAGGIVGHNKYGGKVTECYNWASVTASEAAGGIVGYEYTTSLFTISKCWSSGDITAPVVGGIAGYIGFGSIEECYTSGNITGNYAGGIAAYAGSEIIKNCSSTANVVAESEEEEDSFAGGIVGVGLKYSSYQGTSIQNCYATGKISSNYAAGGIAGLNRSDAGSITHCVALNIEGISEIAKDKLSLKASPEVSLGRITADKQGTLTSNFASPLIPGDWTDEASGKDGDDLTSTNFTQGNGNAFDGWDDTDVWSFDPDGINLPILKVFGENSAGKPVQPNIPKSDFLTFTVKYDTPQNGTITVSSSTENFIQSGAPVAGGTELIISATPNDGYELTSLNVNDNPFKSGDTYTVTGDVKISASFDVKPTPPDPDPVIPDPDPTPTVFHSVTLPQVEGATTDPIAGIYEVEAWSSFRFYLTLDKEYDLSEPVVTTDRGETITPRNSDGAYIIKYIRQPVEIYIDNIVKNPDPVANETIKTDQSKVWTEGGCLHIISATTGQLYIYTVEGKLQKKQPVITDETVTIPLPEGFYIIRINNEQFKVII